MDEDEVCLPLQGSAPLLGEWPISPPMASGVRPPILGTGLPKSGSSPGVTAGMGQRPGGPLLPSIRVPVPTGSGEDSPLSGRSRATPKASSSVSPRSVGRRSVTGAGTRGRGGGDGDGRALSVGRSGTSAVFRPDRLVTISTYSPVGDGRAHETSGARGEPTPLGHGKSLGPGGFRGPDGASVASDASDGSGIRRTVSEAVRADSPAGLAHSAKAWCLADEVTGQVLLAHNPDLRLQIASITKLMTAWIVVDAARHEPEVTRVVCPCPLCHPC